MGGATKTSLVLAAALCAAVSPPAAVRRPLRPRRRRSAESAVDGGGSSDQAGGADGDAGRGRLEQRRRRTRGSSGSGDGGGDSGGRRRRLRHRAGVDFTAADQARAPAPVEGERSDGFRVPGGDNSIQEYGEEQDADERDGGDGSRSRLSTRPSPSGDWTAVCAPTSRPATVKQIELARRKKLRSSKARAAPRSSAASAARRRKGPRTRPTASIVSFRIEDDTRLRHLLRNRRQGLRDAAGKSEGGSLEARPPSRRRRCRSGLLGAQAACSRGSSPIQTTCSRSGPTPTSLIGTPTNSAM